MHVRYLVRRIADIHLLSSLLNQGLRISHHPRHKFSGLPFLQRSKLRHTGPRAHELVHVLPEFPESRTILKKTHGSVPPDDLATHRSDGAIGLCCRSLFEQIGGDFGRVDDYHIFSHDVEVYDFTWHGNS